MTMRRWLIGMVILLAGTGRVGAALTDSQKMAVIDRRVGAAGWSGAPVPADELVRAFRNNRIAADRAVTRQVIAVRGEIQRVDREGSVAYVELSGSTEDDPCLQTVRCYFTRQREGALAALRAGRRVTIRGMVASTGTFGDVLMLGCRLEPKARRR